MKMASMKLKTAYVLFLISFFVWLSVVLIVCFPSGVWPSPVRFPSSSMLALFFGSAIVAAVSCLIIGFDYLGLNFKPKRRPKSVPQTPKLTTTIPVWQQAKAAGTIEAELQDSTQQEDTISILVPPQLEEEQENE
jgi:hypothetical protein